MFNLHKLKAPNYFQDQTLWQSNPLDQHNKTMLDQHNQTM